MHGGSTPNKSNDDYWRNGDVPWVSPKDMKVPVISDSEDHITELALEESTLRLFEPPTVLMVVRGMILAHTYPVALTSAPVTINQDMKGLTPKAECSTEYLALLLRGISGVILGIVEESAHGTKVLRTDLWKSTEVFLPPRLEQDKIIETLNARLAKHDALIAKVTLAIERLREYRTALISAAVTGKIDVRGHVEGGG
jgi:type I restriction enzyme S subunit